MPTDRRRHNGLYHLGARCAAHPLRVLGVWAGVLAAALALAAIVGTRFADDLRVPGTGSQRAADVLADRFAARSAGAVLVAVAHDGSIADEGEALAALAEATRAIPHVADVGEPRPSPDGAAMILPIGFDVPPGQLAGAAAALGAVRDASGRLDVAAGGEAIAMNSEPAPGSAELIGLAVALVILLFAFGSVGAAVVPLITALVSVVVGVIIVGLAGHGIAVSSAAPMLAGMLGLGAGIDYALFLVTRAREELAAGADPVTAIARAVSRAGHAVLFAGACVVVAILGLALSGVALIAALGFAAAVVVATSVVAALTLVPALLGLFGSRLDALRVPVIRGDGTSFGRWARRVARKPWRFALAGTVLLLALAAPALDMRLGFPDDGAQPAGAPARRAYDMIASHYGPGVNGPLAIVVEGTAADAAAVAAAVAADPEISMVEPPIASTDGRAHVVIAIPRHAPQDPEVAALVHRLRDDTLPAATGARVSVGGAVATTIDLAEVIAARLPRVIAAVMVASFVLLVGVFRSLVVPIKAVLLNLLSVGAAYGVLVVVFQWGVGRSLIGLDHAVPIVSLLPMLLFAVLFGLSMDYEVFLLARVREEHDRGVPTAEAVANALRSTGRVVSSAALIMVSVFVAFALGSDPMVKMFGVGLAAAVLVDATVVRLILVPAFLVLMGSANWWFPGAGRPAPR